MVWVWETWNCLWNWLWSCLWASIILVGVLEFRKFRKRNRQKGYSKGRDPRQNGSESREAKANHKTRMRNECKRMQTKARKGKTKAKQSATKANKGELFGALNWVVTIIVSVIHDCLKHDWLRLLHTFFPLECCPSSRTRFRLRWVCQPVVSHQVINPCQLFVWS